MEVTLKSPEEIDIMRESGAILAEILHALKNKVRAGITTASLNEKADALFLEHKVQASFKGFRGYPAGICTSVNEEVVHTIPGKRVLHEGDIITIDAGVYHKGFHTDSAITVMVGEVRPEVKRFLETVESVLYKTIQLAKPGVKVGDLSYLIQKSVEEKGYSPVHELTGHGIGKTLHEPPAIPNFGKKGTGLSLKPGMTLAIEPIVNMGKRHIKTLSDGWTIVSVDGSLSCQYEHTIVITQTGSEILTRMKK